MPDQVRVINVSTGSLLVAAAIPGLMALALAWPVRRHASRRALGALFVLGGFVSHVLTVGLNGLLTPIEAALVGAPDSIRTGLAEAFLTAALSEELARFLVALLVMIAFRTSVARDAELSCAMIGLGFAAYENAIFSFPVRGPGEVLVARALASITHGAMAVIMGSLLRRAFAAPRTRPGPLLLALLVPLLLHGLYDSGVFLLQNHEIPEPSDEPTGRELAALGAALAMMLPVLTVWLWQVIWGVRIVRSLRRDARARIVSAEPVVGRSRVFRRMRMDQRLVFKATGWALLIAAGSYLAMTWYTQGRIPPTGGLLGILGAVGGYLIGRGDDMQRPPPT